MLIVGNALNISVLAELGEMEVREATKVSVKQKSFLIQTLNRP